MDVSIPDPPCTLTQKLNWKVASPSGWIGRVDDPAEEAGQAPSWEVGGPRKILTNESKCAVGYSLDTIRDVKVQQSPPAKNRSFFDRIIFLVKASRA